MPEPTHPTESNGRVEHPEVRHETSDVKFRWILGLVITAAILGVLIHVGVWLFLSGWSRHEAAVKRSPFPLAQGPSTALPANPRLEQVDRMAGDEKPDVYRRFTIREDILDTYGPTGEEGYVRVPIDRAIDALAATPPKSRAAPPPDRERRAGGLLDAGEPNSGRLFRRSQP